MIENIENDLIISSLNLPNILKKAMKHNRYMRVNMNYKGKTRAVIRLKK
jgi:hypothetical protein